MKWWTLIYRELVQRKSKLLTSGFAVVLGVAVVVAIHTISTYSEKAVSKELDALGANILILPKNATTEDYYSADLDAGVIPEEHVTTLALSNLEGLDNVSPKLSIQVAHGTRQITLTGILPTNEFQGKASWQGAGIFSRPQGCGNVEDLFGLVAQAPAETSVRKRVIETLEPDEVLLGADVAERLSLAEDDELILLNEAFVVSAVLPRTGTVDDGRIFAHLHTVQTLAGQEGMLNVIEVVGCCEEISKGLVGKLDTLLPDTKIVTISQIVDTQVRTNTLMKALSQLFLVIIVVMGAASIANDMYNNVYERRKEIGTLLALGAAPRSVLKVFLSKAAVLGVIGGCLGYLVGTLAALILGPILAGVPVLPIQELLVWAVGLSLATALLASYLPARYAAHLDPTDVLKEL